MGPTIFLTIFLVIVIVVAVTAAWAGVRAAPFVPSRGRDIQRVMRLAELKPGQTLVDCGCGDGRLVLAAAAVGAEAVGYEISVLPWLVSWLRGKLSPDRQRIHIRFGDFFHADLSRFDVVACFLTPSAMKKLGAQLARQPRPQRRVVSYAFQIHDWQPAVKDKPNPREFALWLYRG